MPDRHASKAIAVPTGSDDERPSSFFQVDPVGPQRTVAQVSHETYAPVSGAEVFRTGFIYLTLLALTPVLVGSGDLELPDQPEDDPSLALRAYQTFVRSADGLIVPGSSLKGVARSYAEALSPSCVPGELDACASGDRLCPACAIFGAAGHGPNASYAARATFLDLVSDTVATEVIDIEGRWPPHELRGRKFYRHLDEVRRGYGGNSERVEVLPTGTRFSPHAGAAAVSFRNLRDWELGLLFLALGRDPARRFTLKLGGGKGLGLGTVVVETGRMLERGTAAFGKVSEPRGSDAPNVAGSDHGYFTTVYLECAGRAWGDVVRSQIEGNASRFVANSGPVPVTPAAGGGR
jgi:CRISPR/Cas system CSM-associated protein Csm3 (group 7 of RAMP superfamily)